MKTPWISLLVLFAIVLASCETNQTGGDNENSSPGDNKPISPTETLAPTEDPLQAPTSQTYPDTSNVSVNKFIDIAQLDLAKLLNTSTDQIEIIKTSEIVWPDSSMGCPSPGKAYTQMKIPGYRIWLKAENVEYVYHAGTNGQVIYCPDPSPDNANPPLPGLTNPTPQIGVPIN